MREHIKIELVFGRYKQTRYELSGKMGDRDTIKFSCDYPEFLFFYLERYKDNIETAEFCSNASPIPEEMLENVKKMKEILGAERCL